MPHALQAGTRRADDMRKADVKTERDVVEFLDGWSEFEQAVYLATFRIPKGKVTTYGTIAKIVGKPGASRAARRSTRR